MPRYLSFSEISDHMTCRMRHALRYEFRLDPEGMVSESLDIGRAVHEALEAFLKGTGVDAGLDRWHAKAVENLPLDDPSLVAKLDERRAMASAIVERTIAALFDAKLRLALDALGQPIVEKRLIVPLDAGMGFWDGFVMKLDAMMLDEAGALWQVDFKTRRTLYPDDNESTNLQNAVYQAGAHVSGYPVVGSITVQILSVAPSRPKRNKGGEFSRAQIKTDWRTYAETVAAAGLDPADYEAEMRPKLGDAEFVRVSKVIRPARMLERVWNDIVEPMATEIAVARSGLRASMSDPLFDFTVAKTVRHVSGRTCPGCPYPGPCLGALKGYDAGTTLAHGWKMNDRADMPRIIQLLGV